MDSRLFVMWFLAGEPSLGLSSDLLRAETPHTLSHITYLPHTHHTAPPSSDAHLYRTPSILTTLTLLTYITRTIVVVELRVGFAFSSCSG